MMSLKSVEDLEVFKLAHRLVLDVYRLTADLPSREMFGLPSQMRRAAVSVTANLIEGSEREGSQEFRRYVSISRGSAAEVRYLMRLGAELNLLEKGRASELIGRYNSVMRMLTKLYQSLDRRPATGDRRRAFTLLEMIIVIVLVAVLTGIAISRLSGTSRVKLEQAARMVSHDLNFARDWAMTHATSVRVVFDLDNDTYGASYYSVDANNWEWISSYSLGSALYVVMDEQFDDVDISDFIIDGGAAAGVGYSSVAFSSLGTPRHAYNGTPLTAGLQNRIELKFGADYTEYVSIQPYSGYIYICSQ